MAIRPRIRSIYLQDVFQFTRRDLVDRCHGVSRRFDRVLDITADAHLPRRRFEMLIHSVVSAGECIEYGHRARSLYQSVFQRFNALSKTFPEGCVLYSSEKEGFKWNKLTALNECPCREDFKEASCHLVGQRITLNAVPNEWIRFRLVFSNGITSAGRVYFEASFTTRNSLNDCSALAFLHLMYHLSPEAGSCLEFVDSADRYATRNRLRLNMELGVAENGVQAFKWTQLCCRNLRCL